MPVAAALNMDHIESKINEPSNATISQWDILKNISIPGPKVVPSDLIYFGLRDYESAEKNIIDQHHIQFYKVEQMREKGLLYCVKEAIQQLNNCDQIYISFDVDSMDCDTVSYGTGTPVPVGFSSEEITQIIEQFLLTGKVCCIEFAEINPLLDNKGNKMAETAFLVLDQIAKSLILTSK